MAAQYSHYTWERYCELPGADWWVDDMLGGDSKSGVLMYYRFKTMMEALHNQDIEHAPKPNGGAKVGKGARKR